MTSPTHLRWPPERFYWSVLEAPGFKQAGPLPIGLRPALDEDVPGEPEDMHAVCYPMGDGRLAVCAIAKADLAGIDADALSLTPARVPPFLDGAVSPDPFNLLVGDMEPAPIRRARLRRHAVRAAIALLCGSLVTAGLLRRTAHWDSIAASAAQAGDMVVTAVDPAGTAQGLALELARLRRATETVSRARPTFDAALALADLLKAWPVGVPSKPQSVTVSGAGATISVAVEGDAAPFLKALAPPPGWTLEEPRLSAVENITRLTLQLRPSQGVRP